MTLPDATWLTASETELFCFVAGLYGVGFWLPTIIWGMGVKSPLNVGFLTAMPYAAGAIGMVLVGKNADYHRERWGHVAIPAGLGATGLVFRVSLSGHTVPRIACSVRPPFPARGPAAIPPQGGEAPYLAPSPICIAFSKRCQRGSILAPASKLPAQMIPCPRHVAVDRANRYAEPSGDLGMRQFFDARAERHRGRAGAVRIGRLRAAAAQNRA
jgi:hypothetical protein